FRIALLGAFALKEVTQNGDIAQAGHLVHDISHAIVHQSSNHKTLAILQFEFGISATRAQSRNREAGNRQRVGEIEGADFRYNPQMDIPAGHNYRGKFQSNTEFLELNTYRRKARSRLHDRKGKLAARQETGLFAVDRDQVRFRKDL